MSLITKQELFTFCGDKVEIEKTCISEIGGVHFIKGTLFFKVTLDKSVKITRGSLRRHPWAYIEKIVSGDDPQCKIFGSEEVVKSVLNSRGPRSPRNSSDLRDPKEQHMAIPITIAAEVQGETGSIEITWKEQTDFKISSVQLLVEYPQKIDESLMC